MGSFGSSRHPPKPTPVEMVTTSEYFRASLGALDCDAAALLEKWCPRTYTEHLIDEASGEYVLTARCQQPKTRKSILMGIRTAFSNSGVQLSLQGRDLQLLTDEQYEKAASPELNDSYEDLLELRQRLKAARARDDTSPFLESLNDC